MDDLLPNEFHLSQNYPNPFKEKTAIKYCVPYKSPIKITILDSDMRILKELENEVKEPGTYEVEFSIKNGTHTGSNIHHLQSGTTNP